MVKNRSFRQRNNGFTLIELVVVVAVMGVLSLVFTGVLTQTLRSQNKVKLINQIKQDGQTVLDQLTNEIRLAQKIICVGATTGNPNDNDTLITYRNNLYSRFRFIPATTNSNGYFKRNDFTQEAFDPTADLCEEPGDRSEQEGAQPIVAYLTDLDVSSGVSVDYDVEGGSRQPIFQISSSDGYTDTIIIRFRMKQGKSASLNYESSMGDEGVLFVTAVQSRASN